MDLNSAIRELHKELDKLNQVIASLEELELTGVLPTAARRGRKSMGDDERQLVSERMKKYWAGRRKQKIAAGHA